MPSHYGKKKPMGKKKPKKNGKKKKGLTAKQKTAYEIASCLVGSEMCIRDSCTQE